MKLTLKRLTVDLDRREPVYTRQMQDKQAHRGAEPTSIIHNHLLTLPSLTLEEMLDTPDA